VGGVKAAKFVGFLLGKGVVWARNGKKQRLVMMIFK
jgi:hypothetical protein